MKAKLIRWLRPEVKRTNTRNTGNGTTNNDSGRQSAKLGAKEVRTGDPPSGRFLHCNSTPFAEINRGVVWKAMCTASALEWIISG